MESGSDRARRWIAGGCGAAGAMVYAPRAWAAGGGSGGDLEIFLILVAVVAVAYLVAHLLIERIAERFGVVTGIEYIVLGAVVFRFVAAPVVPGAEGHGVEAQIELLIEKLHPVLVLGTGSLGLLWGTYVDLREFDAIDRASFPPALVASGTTFVAVAGLPAAVVAYLYPIEILLEALPLLVCAGAIAMVAADGPLRGLAAFFEAAGEAPRVAVRVTGWCSALAIVTFGLLFCFDPSHPLVGSAWLASLLRLGLHIVVGGTLGMVFGAFLRRDFADEKILTVVIGMVVFTSGLADGLDLSPIFVNFVLGGVLINTCANGDHVRSRLESIKHPLYIVLFLLAGAHLDFGVPFWAYLLAVPYLLLRVGGRWIGGLLSSPGTESQPDLPTMGRVLLAPGALSVAMAIDFVTIRPEGIGELPVPGGVSGVDAFYSALIVAIVVSEVLAYVLTRTWLIDAADVSTSPGDRAHGADTRRPDAREVR